MLSSVRQQINSFFGPSVLSVVCVRSHGYRASIKLGLENLLTSTWIAQCLSILVLNKHKLSLSVLRSGTLLSFQRSLKGHP